MGTHPIFESDFDCLTDRFGFLDNPPPFTVLPGPPDQTKRAGWDTGQSKVTLSTVFVSVVEDVRGLYLRELLMASLPTRGSTPSRTNALTKLSQRNVLVVNANHCVY